MHTVINKTKRILKKTCIMKLAALQVFFITQSFKKWYWMQIELKWKEKFLNRSHFKTSEFK